MIDAVNVLQIEDSPTVVQLTRSMLAEANGATIELESGESLSEGIQRVARGGFDVVLLDLILPDSQGLDTFRVFNAAAKVPDVIFTNVDDEEQSLVALREGAADYLIKSEVTPKWLARSLRYAVSRAHNLSADSGKDAADSAPAERLIEIEQSEQDPGTFLTRITSKRVVNVVALEAAKNRLLNVVRRNDCERVELDFTEVEYVANAAISMFLIIHKKAKTSDASVVLTNVSSQVYDQFSSRRFDKVFTIKQATSG